MLSVSVPDNVKEVLDIITPHFEKRLQEDFINEGFRKQKRNENMQHNLDDVFFTDGNIHFELSNLNVTGMHLSNLKKFVLNLEMLNVDIEVMLNQLIIQGDFKQSTMKTLVPMSKWGKVTFVMDDVSLNGTVGIYVVEDSFVTENYDLNMRPSKISTKVVCLEDLHLSLFESVDTDIGTTFMKYIARQIILMLQREIIQRQLSSTIVESSVSELFLDEPGDIKAISLQRASEANNIVDLLLKCMNEYIKTSNSTVLQTSPLLVSFIQKKKNEFFESGFGSLEDLSTLVRAGNMSVYENEGIQYIYGIVKLSNFKFKYISCKIKDDSGMIEDGRIEGGAYRSYIFIKLSFSKGNDTTSMSVEKVQVLDLRDIDFNIFNLDEFKHYHHRLKSCVMGNLWSNVFPLLEDKIREGLLMAFKKRQT